MDKLASKLREDASRIDAQVSAQLESRIRASLNAIEPESARQRKAARRPISFWLASSLTGITVGLPVLELEIEAATLTSPLARELEDLQADLKKAEELVRGDVRIDL